MLDVAEDLLQVRLHLLLRPVCDLQAIKVILNVLHTLDDGAQQVVIRRLLHDIREETFSLLELPIDRREHGN